jgi:hypothetical protein
MVTGLPSSLLDCPQAGSTASIFLLGKMADGRAAFVTPVPSTVDGDRAGSGCGDGRRSLKLS